MDLYVEKQCVDQMKAGDLKKFLILFDAYFSDLYRYVARRVNNSMETERIVRITFLEALGQTRNVPTDTAYQVWLYGLAKKKTWNFIEKSRFPEKQGLIDSKDFSSVADIVKDPILQKADGMMKKLSLEEAEILRLKFCEELADGDVLYIIGGEENTIGSKIYRVLKRAHFLLFGESDERQGVYFGELSGFLTRAKDANKIEVPEVLKLSLKAEISNKVEKRDFAVNAEVRDVPPPVKTVAAEEKIASKKVPWQEFKKDDVPVGSNDPAKIFVQAVKEMRQEEDAQKMRDAMEFETTEKVYEFFDKWKGVLSIIPIVLFIAVGVFVATKINWNDDKPPIEKPPVEVVFKSVCGDKVTFDKALSQDDRKNIDDGVNKKICENFKVKNLSVKKLLDKEIEVLVDVDGAKLEYKFVYNVSEWQVVKYVKTANSDKQSGEVQGNNRSLGRA